MHPELHLQQKADKIFESRPGITVHSLWFDIIVYSFFVFVIVSAYYFVTEGRYDISTIISATANVGLLLIGLSFMLSGLCYFWNFADHYIIYRKQLGVVGFVYTLLHTLILLARSGSLSMLVPKSITTARDISLLSAEIAIVMYLGMIIISTKFMIKEIGGKRWRQLLRAGYIAFILSIVHMAIKGYDVWLLWLRGDSTLFPPFGLLVFLFGVAVIGLRIVLQFATYKKIETTPAISPPSPPPAPSPVPSP